MRPPGQAGWPGGAGRGGVSWRGAWRDVFSGEAIRGAVTLPAYGYRWLIPAE